MMPKEGYEIFIQAIAKLAELRQKYAATISGDWIMRDYSLAIEHGPEEYLNRSRQNYEVVLQKIQEHKLKRDGFDA